MVGLQALGGEQPEAHQVAYEFPPTSQAVLDATERQLGLPHVRL